MIIELTRISLTWKNKCKKHMTKVIRLVGQAVKTPPSHGGNRGSIPLRAVSINNKYGINRKHCEAKSLVRKQKCEKCN